MKEKLEFQRVTVKIFLIPPNRQPRERTEKHIPPPTAIKPNSEIVKKPTTPVKFQETIKRIR